MVDGKKLPSVKKIIFVVFCIIVVAVILIIVALIGFRTYPLLAIFGFVSLWVTMAIIFLLLFVSAIISHWRCAKLDFKAWKDSMIGSPLKIRYEAGRYVRSLIAHDPVMQKIGKISSKIAKICLLAWFVILVLAICLVLYLDRIGIWRDLISK
jgi:small-conductance mechanosensitive channel